MTIGPKDWANEVQPPSSRREPRRSWHKFLIAVIVLPLGVVALPLLLWGLAFAWRGVDYLAFRAATPIQIRLVGIDSEDIDGVRELRFEIATPTDLEAFSLTHDLMVFPDIYACKGGKLNKGDALLEGDVYGLFDAVGQVGPWPPFSQDPRSAPLAQGHTPPGSDGEYHYVFFVPLRLPDFSDPRHVRREGPGHHFSRDLSVGDDAVRFSLAPIPSQLCIEVNGDSNPHGGEYNIFMPPRSLYFGSNVIVAPREEVQRAVSSAERNGSTGPH